MQDVRKFHQSFCSEKDKQVQNCLILEYTQSESPKSVRHRGERKQIRETTNRYLTRHRRTEHVHVCKKYFCSILGISEKRVQRVYSKYFKTGLQPSVNRGGDHKSHYFAEKKTAVKSFIESLVPLVKDYCRASSNVTQYFPS
ncbi:hypothetical protein PR048_013177 [Dryococelus australis]|uniref:Helix-turn-helix domain-containing protein n=1 Tax=Dryococelus australis TaxID=614101 RepID=A0ABQ9HRE5_9NEOP|nr:hypothetical protein PR048_013177 [Dryococelus australis]